MKERGFLVINAVQNITSSDFVVLDNLYMGRFDIR